MYIEQMKGSAKRNPETSKWIAAACGAKGENVKKVKYDCLCVLRGERRRGPTGGPKPHSLG